MGGVKKRLWVVDALQALICLGICAYLVNLTLLNSQNYIFHNGHWENSNKYLRLVAYRPVDAEWSRIVLANNHLNMSSLNGYQIFQTKETKAPIKIQFVMDRTEESYVDVIFNVVNRQGSGIRLGASGNFSFTFDVEGRFTTKTPLNLPFLSPGVHEVVIESSHPESLWLRVDGGERWTLAGQHFSEGAVGFRGSERPLIIDDVQINYADGSVFEESFENSDRGHLFFEKNFLIILVLAFFIAGLIAWRTQTSFGRRLAKVSVSFLAFSAIWFSFDFYFLWRQPSANFLIIDESKKSFAQKMERQRQRFFWA